MRKFPFAEGYNLEATARGRADGKEFAVTFENVFDFGLVIRSPVGSVYRMPEKSWLRLEDDRPVNDPALEAFLEVAKATQPPELSGIRL